MAPCRASTKNYFLKNEKGTNRLCSHFTHNKIYHCLVANPISLSRKGIQPPPQEKMDAGCILPLGLCNLCIWPRVTISRSALAPAERDRGSLWGLVGICRRSRQAAVDAGMPDRSPPVGRWQWVIEDAANCISTVAQGLPRDTGESQPLRQPHSSAVSIVA